MFCEKCGKQINDDAVFCPFCGYTVDKQQDNTGDSAVQIKDANTQSVSTKAEISKAEFLDLEENSKLKKAIKTDCILTYILAGLWIIVGLANEAIYIVPLSVIIIVVTIVMVHEKYNYIGGIVVLVLSIIAISPFGIGVAISLIRNLMKLDKSYSGHISS